MWAAAGLLKQARSGFESQLKHFDEWQAGGGQKAGGL